MFIDHISVYAENPEETKDFYVKHFEGLSSGKLTNEETGTPSYYVTFGGGGSAKLEVVESDKDHEPAKFTFMLDSEEDVDKKVAELKKEGYTIVNEPHQTEDGYYSAMALDPADNKVEILYGRPGGLHCALEHQRKR